MPALNVKRNLPEYISGFVDGEGSFCVSFSRRKKLLVGWETKPSFSVGQKEERANVLGLMQKFFGCGFMRKDSSDGTVKYEVRSLNDLISKIIPHFEKYQLKGRKQNDFIAFKKAVEIMKTNKHLEKEGLKAIIFLASSMTKNPRRIKNLQNIITLLKV